MTEFDLPKGFEDVLKLEKRLHNWPEKKWQKLGEDRAIRLFHSMSRRVPAYKDFLKKNSLNPKKIKTIEDLSLVPPVDKDNYLRVYPREMLCWDGDLKGESWTISSTSGSTGKPFYFPRRSGQDWQYAIVAELYLRCNFDIQNKSTLYIVAFPMGAWIGGVFTYEAIRLVAQRGNYKLSTITPGINKQEILEAVKQLGKDFDQVIIGSYAPFLKDILDDGVRQGIKWADYNLGFIFSAEGFNEVFRDYVMRKTGIDNPYLSTLNHYGTVDLGTMAHETPLSILLRREALKNPDIYSSLFSRADKLPTFAQYNPALFYFEQADNTLYCSAYSGIPLVRYNLRDTGGVISQQEIIHRLDKIGINLHRLSKEAGLDKTIWNLPFVYVYERDDFSVSFYAFLLHPEMIKRPLQDSKFEKFITSKFTMEVMFDNHGRQKLTVNIELKPDQKSDVNLKRKIEDVLVTALKNQSSEYRETYSQYGSALNPEIIFWPYEHQKYFKPGIKQQWVKKADKEMVWKI